MQIVLVETRGFCPGVRRVITMAERLCDEGKEVTAMGPPVHNPAEVRRLIERGLKVVDVPDEVQTQTVITRSHGIPRDAEQKLKARGLDVVDGTCPVLVRMHELVASLEREDYQIVIVGDERHPEVEALKSRAGDRCLVVREAADIDRTQLSDRVAVIAQTTIEPERFSSVAEGLRGMVTELKEYNTICRTTIKRRQEALALAAQVDVMLVIGGRDSANTKKLAELCRSEGVPTHHIEYPSEIDLQWFENREVIGVTTGASTPDWVLKEVLEVMEEMEKKDKEKELEEMAPEVEQEEAAGGAEAEEPLTEDVTEEEVKGAAEEQTAETDEQDNIPTADQEGQVTEGRVELDPARDAEAKMQALQEGELVTGRVVEIDDDGVMVDVGYKSEGFVPRRELTGDPKVNPKDVVSKDEDIEVYVVRVDDPDKGIILSMRRARYERGWKRAYEAFEANETVKVKVIRVVKGGLLVSYDSVRGFMPASHVEERFVPDLSGYLNRMLSARIIEIDKSNNKLIFSHKEVVAAEREEKAKETWAELEEGQIREGIVKKITNFGAFVDLGGVDGLVHISEMSWGRIDHPKEVVKEGEKVKVMVLNVDREAGRISLGIKQTIPDPWDTVADKYHEDEVVEGRVVGIVGFGAFVEIEPGLEGLVHISELAPYHVDRPDDVVSIGQKIRTKILSINQQDRRLSLSVRALHDTPQKQEANYEEYLSQDEKGGVTIGELCAEQFEKVKVEDDNSEEE